MAVLFDCSTDNISLHLKNIFESEEIDKETVVEEFSVTASDGKNYKRKHKYYEREPIYLAKKVKSLEKLQITLE